MRKIAYRACLILLFIVPWENFVVIPGVGTISRFSGFIVITLWLISLVSTNELRNLRPFHMVVFFFLVWQVVSVTWSIDREASWARIGTLFQLLVLMIMVWDLFRDLADLENCMQAYLFGGWITSGSVLFNFYQSTFVTEFRTSAEGFNLNDASLILAIGIPFAWYLATQIEQKSALTKWLNYLYIPVAVIAILLTGGRVSLASTVPGFLFVLGTVKNLSLRWRLLTLFSLIVVVFSAQSLIPQATVDRLLSGTVSEVEDLDLNGRKEIWLRAVDEYVNEPFLGIGVGAGPKALQASVHNTLIAVVLETGLMGLLLLMWMLYKLGQELNRQPSLLLRSLWVNVFWIVALANLLHSWQYRKQTWLVLTFMLISANLMERADQAVPSMETAPSSLQVS